MSEVLPPTRRASCHLNRVTIAYRAIDFKTIPEKRQYQYRIKEIDADWRKPPKENTFDEAFDKPGIYTFEVVAIDRDLNYSQPASIILKVVSPFYLRASFFVPTMGGGTLALVMLVIQAIVRLKRRRQIYAYQQLAVCELQDARVSKRGSCLKSHRKSKAWKLAVDAFRQIPSAAIFLTISRPMDKSPSLWVM